MHHKIAVAACLATFALAGCQPSAPTDQPATGVAVTDPAAESAPVDVMPSDAPLSSADAPTFDKRAFAGTFEGTIPCADCPGIDSTLVLRPDGSYELTDVYQERDTRATTDGTWSVEDGDTRIRLDPNSKDGVDRLFGIESDSRIVMLDAEGERIESGLDYSLERRAQ